MLVIRSRGLELLDRKQHNEGRGDTSNDRGNLYNKLRKKYEKKKSVIKGNSS